jgi:NADPH:quinone reductase-like Zn-dependent oxidoreductase
MKAIVYLSFGPPDVLQLEERAKPVPGDNEILIKVHATTVTSGDIHLRKGEPLLARLFAGPITPRNPVLGHEFAGVIEAIGKDVKLFAGGDHVFGSTNLSSGTYAEYLCLPEDGIIASKPENISFEQAAAVPVGALTALYFLRKGNIQPGQQVLVYGASGSVGTFAVQLACQLGAEVTGVCSSSNTDLVKNLGASRVIDYTSEDFTSRGKHYDMIFDSVGKTTFSQCKSALKPDGYFVTTAVSLPLVVQKLRSSFFDNKKLIIGIAGQTPEDLQFIKGLVDAGSIKPVIDRNYSLHQIAEAHAYVEQGHKKGNVVIQVTAREDDF